MTAFVGVNTDSLSSGTYTFTTADAPSGSEFVLIHLFQYATILGNISQTSGGGAAGTMPAGLYTQMIWRGSITDFPVTITSDQAVDVTIVGYTSAASFAPWPHNTELGSGFAQITQLSNTVAPLEQYEIAPDPFDLASRGAATFSVVEIVATNGSLSISGSPSFTPTVTSRYVGTRVAVADDLNKTLPATTRGFRYDLGGTYSYGCGPFILIPGTLAVRKRRGLGMVRG